MHIKTVVVVGGGVSGLATAHYLKQRAPGLEVILLEKEDRVGGHFLTEKQEGFVVEKGPYCFKQEIGSSIFSLANDLRFSSSIIKGNKKAEKRFLVKQGIPYPLPLTGKEMLFSPLTKGLLPALLLSRNVSNQDQSVYTFMQRNVGRKVTESFFDAFSLSIHGADVRKASIKSLFPNLFTEVMYKKNFWHLMKRLILFPKKPFSQYYTHVNPFSFKLGNESFTQKLGQELYPYIQKKAQVMQISSQGKGFIVKTEKESFEVDAVFLATPHPTAAHLLQTINPSIAEELKTLPTSCLISLQLQYQSLSMKKPYTGFLFPSSENTPVMNFFFDSCVYPQKYPIEQTSITATLGGEHHPKSRFFSLEEMLNHALPLLKKYAGITVNPDLATFTKVEHIPQFYVGHIQKMETIERRLKSDNPNIYLVGNYFTTTAVSQCIQKAEQQTRSFLKTIRR